MIQPASGSRRLLAAALLTMALLSLILAIVLAANAQVRVILLVSTLIFMGAASVVALSNSLSNIKR